MNICESLTVTAKLFPDRIAIHFGDKRFTYQQLNRRSAKAAEILADGGVQPGDRVALMLPNAPSFPIWYYAALRIGAIAVSVSTRLAPTEVEFVVTDCGAHAVVANPEAMKTIASALPNDLALRLSVEDSDGGIVDGSQLDAGDDPDEQAWYDADPDTAALILYTSGTTGFPKGATLSHGNVRSNVHAFNHLCNMQTSDVVLLAVPLFHCFGQNALLNSVLNVGGTIVLQRRFDLNESRRLITEHGVTQLYGVPMMFGLMLDSCSVQDLASVNYCFSAAATLPTQTETAWQSKFGMPLYAGYGLTETSPFATYNHRIKFVPGSIGTAIDSVEIRIVDSETGQPQSTGELGEIAIRGPNVMLGYWNRPDETAAAIRDGWFHSGDIGRIDENGYLYIVDRVKDMITIGGLKVFPAEVERVLLDHPAVAQAAVIGIPDSVFGEQVLGYVVLNESEAADKSADAATALESLRQHAKANLGNYKIPRLAVIKELPRNPSGKVLKTKLRELAAAGSPTSPTSPLGTVSAEAGRSANLKPASLRQILAKTHASERTHVAVSFLQTQVCDICELDESPHPEASFVEAGLDSMAIVDLSAQLQTEVGPDSELRPTLLFDYPRIIDMAGYLIETILGEKDTKEMKTEIQQMSEAEALAELMKELG